jgi:predicted phage terminase large subunit-like protein
VTRGEIKRLVINVPPGSSKSILTGVMWPSWTWTHSPQTKWITSSYAENVARRDAMRAQVIMLSDWYQARWGSRWRPHHADWTTMRYSTDKGGLRLAVTVGGGVTGDHADHQLVDDPIKPLDAREGKVDTAALQRVLDWWDQTMSTRMTDPVTSTRTIIMQRLHDRDLSGHVLAGGEYTHLCLPMRYERKCVVEIRHPCTCADPEMPTPLGYKDERQVGELLWPARFPEEIQAVRLREMGSRAVASQDQQRPVPSGGGVFKAEGIKFWKVWPKVGSELIQSWDFSFKGLDTSDAVAGQVWARHGGEYYLLDQVHGKMGFASSCTAILSLSGKWPKAIRKLVEDKANGSAIIETLRKTVPGLKAVNPEGGKVARANAVEPLFESGCVYLPDPSIAPWVHDFIQELVTFDGQDGRADDMVDACTQALLYLHRKTTGRYKEAMERAQHDPTSLLR